MPNTTIAHLQERAHKNARAKGFHDDGLTPEQFVERHTNLLHEEVSELFSACRTGHLWDDCDKTTAMEMLSLPRLSNAEEEYADIVIRVMDQCARLGIDLERAILAKMAYNETRPHLHGKKF